MSKSTFKRILQNALYNILLLAIFTTAFSACDSDDDGDDIIGNWIELSDFEGVPRTDAVAFTIGDKAYLGTGYDGTYRLTDFWEYDPALNQWTRKADFPGAARSGAVGFGTNTKGYIGTGYDGTNKMNDFYEYDPSTDTWTRIADFGGTARYAAVAFSINNKGYVGTGYDGNSLKDFWEYDPSTGAWTKKLSLGGGKRRDAVAFVIDGKGYICTGIDNGIYEDDFWVYDPSADEWSERRPIYTESTEDYDDDYTDIVGTNKAAFAINGKGYVCTGGKGSAETIVWQYDPSTDLWARKTELEASGRIEAVGFAIGNIGYISTGRNSSYYFDDLWGFLPDDDQVDLDKSFIVNP